MKNPQFVLCGSCREIFQSTEEAKQHMEDEHLSEKTKKETE